MGITDFFRTIQWRSTLQIALIRIGVATILWVLIMILTEELSIHDAGGFFGLTVVWLILLTVAMVVALPVIGLTRAGVPWIGLLALPAWLIVIGDPLVWILWKAKPEWVPVDHFRLVNAPVLAVFIKEDSARDIDNETSAAE